ncbi:hypothetical protein LTR78_005542 [Recurvomyces mirabilis]|uniref:Nucleic acid-binding protein n=1 Tax=Recurvomyces mirabilis TaxID=574656 RepID=A0AAE1C142_9PEZI|nr:hypothetical protein LTR78_005542 [Recurvomyces mirabilis]KAK5158467.1 hypothetical protein LTS14_003486 [Recurvomyces mirabilis]
MSRRSLSLPLRLASSASSQRSSWICRRCLATQAAELPSAIDAVVSTPTLPSGSAATTSQAQHGDPRLSASGRKDPATGRVQTLSRTDRLLKAPLPHPVPEQHLQHTTADYLPEEELWARSRTQPHKKIVGIVVSAGKMEKTVKVRVAGQRWEPRIRKYFADHTDHLVHDPNSSLVIGDVVSLHRLRASKAVHHVVGELMTPYGIPREQRAPIPTPEERLANYKKERVQKLQRRSLRREAAQGDAEAIRKLKAMGLDPGLGAEVGVGQTANLQSSAGKRKVSGKGVALGIKGQKLPEGVLPGGVHEVGRIDGRARRNKERAMRLEEKRERTLVQARKHAAATAGGQGASADPLSGTTISRGRDG